MNVYYWEDPPGVIVRGFDKPVPPCCVRHSFLFDDEADDVYMVKHGYLWDPWAMPNIWTYEPPVLFLDLPLTVGKSWSWSGRRLLGGSLPDGDYTVEFTVTDEREVTVPAGTFSVLVVQILVIDPEYYWGNPFDLPKMLYLHHDLGPVEWSGYRLEAWTGIVPTENRTWSSVKELYR
jgi:hypothetical protein